MREFVRLEQRGDSFFADMFLLAGQELFHKQMEWRDNMRFLRFKKKVIRF